MAEQAERELRLGRASLDDFLELLERMDEARAAIAAVARRATSAAIALTHSTTEASTSPSWAIDLAAGDRVVTSRLEHAGGLGPLYTVRDRLGVDLVMADLGDGGATTSRPWRPSTRRSSRAPGSSRSRTSPWTTGAVLPIARIAELAHARGAMLAVDGAQAIGAIPVDVGALGADFYAMPAQKWLLGPEGMAALYVAPSRPGPGPPDVRRPLLLRDARPDRRRPAVAGRPSVRDLGLPPRRGHGDGAEHRLAVDVRRSRLGPRPGDRDWPARPPTGWPRSPGSSSSRRAGRWRRW